LWETVVTTPLTRKESRHVSLARYSTYLGPFNMGALDNPSDTHKPPIFQFRKRTWRVGRLDNCESLEQSSRGNLLDKAQGSELVRASDRCSLLNTGHCSRRGMYDITGLVPHTAIVPVSVYRSPYGNS